MSAYDEMKVAFSLSLIIITAILMHPATSGTSDYNLHPDPQTNILSKLQSHEIVFLGTRHGQPLILIFVGGLTRKLHDRGVTHIGLKIASEQQSKIDHFLTSGTGLDNVEVCQPIDCPEYRDLFRLLRTMNASKRPAVVGLDRPEAEFSKPVSRDEWMARNISVGFEPNPNA